MGNRRVMIAIDGKKPSDLALQWYLDHMNRHGDHVLLFHCSQFELHVGLPGIAVNVDHVAKQVEKAKADAERITATAMGQLRDLGIKGWIVIKTSHKPSQTIVETATEEDVHHIVMGTRDLGPVKRAFVGSVSTDVVRNAHVPVTIVKTPHHP